MQACPYLQVLTDLLLCDASPVAKRVFNALAEEPETVAAELVPRVCRVQVWCVCMFCADHGRTHALMCRDTALLTVCMPSQGG